MHRAFASVPESCKDQMEAVLKQKLTSAFAKSESWAVDWEKEPLPMLVICVRLHSLHILPLKLEVYWTENRHADLKHKRSVILRWPEI